MTEPTIAPTIAVIIAVYNGERHINAALDSVFRQTLLPAEVIVVDDGSTDRSAELLATSEYAERITLLRQANAGQSAARNLGCCHTSSSLVAFLDQDDQWYPNHLADLAACLAEYPNAGWCYSDFDEIDAEGRLVTRGFHIAHGLQHPKTSLTDMLGQDLMILPSATLVEASAFRAVGGFDEQLCGYEDDDLFIRLFRHHWVGSYVPGSTTLFRTHGASSSMALSFGVSRLRFLDKLVADVPNNVHLNRYYVRDLVIPRLFHSTMDEYLTCLMNGQLDRAATLAELATAIASRARVPLRRKIGLWVVRQPKWCRRALAARGLVPKSVRRRLWSRLAD